MAVNVESKPYKNFPEQSEAYPTFAWDSASSFLGWTAIFFFKCLDLEGMNSVKLWSFCLNHCSIDALIQSSLTSFENTWSTLTCTWRKIILRGIKQGTGRRLWRIVVIWVRPWKMKGNFHRGEGREISGLGNNVHAFIAPHVGAGDAVLDEAVTGTPSRSCHLRAWR